METPQLNKPSIKEKIFCVISEENHNFKISFQNKIDYLQINAVSYFEIEQHIYESTYTISQIKENKVFIIYDSLDEILAEISQLIDNKKLKVYEKTNYIILNIEFPLLKVKEIVFEIKEKSKNDNDKLNGLFSIISEQKKEIDNLKFENINLKEKLQYLEEKMNKIENDNLKVLNIKNGNNILSNIKSKIINLYEHIKFLNSRLQKNEFLKKKEVKYNLIYRATENESLIRKIKEYCGSKVQILLIIKTTKGAKFGGFIQKGINYKSNLNIKDDEAFLFSLDNKIIYDIKKIPLLLLLLNVIQIHILKCMIFILGMKIILILS